MRLEYGLFAKPHGRCSPFWGLPLMSFQERAIVEGEDRPVQWWSSNIELSFFCLCFQERHGANLDKGFSQAPCTKPPLTEISAPQPIHSPEPSFHTSTFTISLWWPNQRNVYVISSGSIKPTLKFVIYYHMTWMTGWLPSLYSSHDFSDDRLNRQMAYHNLIAEPFGQDAWF